MKWINFFANYNITYYVYKINKEDSILIYSSCKNINKSIVIIHGSIYITKNFTNQKKLILAILSKNDIFSLKSKSKKFYYKLIALEETYFISFNLVDLKKFKSNDCFLFNIIISYENTLSKYEIMNEILSQKYAHNRVTQLILFLCLEFGIISKKKIYIPFKLSQKKLAIISNTSTVAINKNIKYYNKKSIYIQNIFNLN
uniref:Global nitrogen transcriptional regulator n=1 Tax=Bostrychia simpliciuscula TaxID=324754 RepID=A0A1Z1M869_9FLOR|nr:global nitrogen transcriptional regulator [Bostrychia simpliciuscula]ARW62170.1 global nitrogen transcriptional regulator [Bostrychia simpliciuscula]